MSSFSDSNFKSDAYAQFRPAYDQQVFDKITSYHKGGLELAVDIGSGTGQAAYPLTKYFKKVIGTDLSHTMIKTANKKITEEFKGKIEFQQSPGEDLSFLADESVDLVTAAQCIHWFNHPKFFAEINRILKPNGTLAFWGYADPVFGEPAVDKAIMDFTYDDPTKLGPYWEQPGRNIVRNLLKDVNAPTENFTDIETYEHHPGLEGEPKSPLIIKREIPLEIYHSYITTWSSYHSWKKAHPSEKDIADRFYEELQNRFKWTPKTKVTVEWLTVLKLARKLPK